MGVKNLHGRTVPSIIIGIFSFRILIINNGSAIDPTLTGKRCKNNRITVLGCVDIACCILIYIFRKSIIPRCWRVNLLLFFADDDDDDDDVLLLLLLLQSTIFVWLIIGLMRLSLLLLSSSAPSLLLLILSLFKQEEDEKNVDDDDDDDGATNWSTIRLDKS